MSIDIGDLPRPTAGHIHRTSNRPMRRCLAIALAALLEPFEAPVLAGESNALDDDTQQAIVPALSGTWYVPENPGQGLTIEVLPTRQELFVGWFTHGSVPGEGGVQAHRWLTAQGPFRGSRAELEVFLTTGGVFEAPAAVRNRPVGTLTLQFQDCTHAVAHYALETVAVTDHSPPASATLAGRMALRRLTPDAACSVPDSVRAALDGALALWSTDPRHYGVSAAIVFPGGGLWRGAVGQSAPGEALLGEEHIHLASIVKTMTSALILRQVDRGLLALDGSARQSLPELSNLPPAITIRQLLTHSAGLPNYTDNAALSTLVVSDPERRFTAAELASYIGAPVFAPGTRTQYTNTAFLLLGMVAERSYGRPLDELFRTELWQPLGLDHVFMPYLDEPTGPIAQSLTPTGLVNPLDRPSRLSLGHGAGGVLATAQDTARWGDALFRGTVISPARQQEMRALIPAAGNIPGESGAGLGIRGYTFLGRTLYGHSGGSSFGNSLLLHDPVSGITVAVLANQGGNADHFELAPRLLSIATLEAL